MNKSLFERIGGEKAVQAVVTKMYEKILADDELAPFFEHSDVEALRRSQKAFVSYAFGGPNHYSGKGLRQSHKQAVDNGLTDRHFDLVAIHLKSAMQELAVPANLIDEAMTIVESTRSDVLNK